MSTQRGATGSSNGSGDERDVELAEVLKEVRRIELQSKRLVTDVMAGGYSSVFRGAGIEFEEVREYEEGDDPRTVDWNVTARLGRPFVKKYADERQLSVLFLMDLSASMESGYGVWSARQVAARICACLAFSAVKNDDKVGMVSFSGDMDRYVPPKKGLGHALRIVRDILYLNASRPAGDLSTGLDFATRVRRRRAVVFLVSDFLDDGWQEALAVCARHHDLVAIRLVAPELGSPPDGLFRVRDPETGRVQVVDWGNTRVRQTYLSRMESWQNKVAADLRQARVDLMDVPIPRVIDHDAISRPILEFFRMRELRGTRR